MSEGPFRAVRPANKTDSDPTATDWGVYDSRIGKVRGAINYTFPFADRLANSMNWAYREGINSVRG